jgi:hypothetical protein
MSGAPHTTVHESPSLQFHPSAIHVASTANQGFHLMTPAYRSRAASFSSNLLYSFSFSTLAVAECPKTLCIVLLSAYLQRAICVFLSFSFLECARRTERKSNAVMSLKGQTRQMGNERPGSGDGLNSTNGVEGGATSEATSKATSEASICRLRGRRRSRSSNVPKRTADAEQEKPLLFIQVPPLSPSVRRTHSLYEAAILCDRFPVFPSQLVGPAGIPSSFFTTPVRMPVAGCGFICARRSWSLGCCFEVARERAIARVESILKAIQDCQYVSSALAFCQRSVKDDLRSPTRVSTIGCCKFINIDRRKHIASTCCRLSVTN